MTVKLQICKNEGANAAFQIKTSSSSVSLQHIIPSRRRAIYHASRCGMPEKAVNFSFSTQNVIQYDFYVRRERRSGPCSDALPGIYAARNYDISNRMHMHSIIRARDEGKRVVYALRRQLLSKNVSRGA